MVMGLPALMIGVVSNFLTSRNINRMLSGSYLVVLARDLSMQRSKLFIAAGVTFGFLAGCGSGDPSPTMREEFENDGEAAFAMAERLDALQDTTALNMPTIGAVTYTGTSAVVVDTASQTTFMIGDATMTADFAAGTVSGNMSNFVGGTGPSTDEDPSDAVLDNLVGYAGTLDLRNGDIGDADASDITAGFGGTLTGGGNTFVFDGVMFGVFKGNPAMGDAPNIRGALVESSEPLTTITANGATADGLAGFVVSK